MQPTTKSALVAGSAILIALVGGGVAAAGEWFSSSPSSRIRKVRTAEMPTFDTGPSAHVRRNGKVSLNWSKLRIAKNIRVTEYVVTRHGGAVAVGVCGTVTKSACVDTNVPPGAWTYTVRSKQGRWEGPNSPHSGVVTVAAVARRVRGADTDNANDTGLPKAPAPQSAESLLPAEPPTALTETEDSDPAPTATGPSDGTDEDPAASDGLTESRS
jgi:hypothetical protein